MNHIYRSAWNQALNTWIAVSELTKGKTKNSSAGANLFAQTFLIAVLWALTDTAYALPTSNELIAGQATVATPTATQMQINQTSDRAVMNWQGFSVGQNEAVNIQQPNAQAALLNRVVGQDVSQIQGKIQANGQVYLTNPNGVIFGKTAQVDVGGLIATTHNIKDADFMAGKNQFTQNGATGSVENHGTINAKDSGVVALIAEQVTNTGAINTPKGTTALVAGKTVDLDFKGDGLVEVKITEAALNAQIENHGAITADGGRVIMTAKAANSLIDTVINQDGIVKAKGLVERNGEIILDGGDNGAVKVNGELNAGNSNLGLNSKGGDIKVTGQTVNIQNNANISATGNDGGGNITLGNKQTTQKTDIEQNAKINVNTLKTGKAGTINVLANMENGKVNVAGQLNASAPNGGDGGFIDTSAAKVNIADSASFDTQASQGETGKWLIDPTDFYINSCCDAQGHRDVTGARLAKYLQVSNVEIQTTSSGTEQGNIYVNDDVVWDGYNKLTLTAHNNIYVNAHLNATEGGSIKLRADSQGTGIGTVVFSTGGQYGFDGIGRITVNNNAAVGIYYNPLSYTDPGTKSDTSGNPYSGFVTTNTGSYLRTYMLVNDINQLQGINTNLSGSYALGKNIDATQTATWNNNAGFEPIGNKNAKFTGTLNGLNNTITGLTINRPNTDEVGLFGFNDGMIRYVGLINANITGHDYTGALAGKNTGNIGDSYATGKVDGNWGVGGLLGYNKGILAESYATANVLAWRDAGGLAGANGAVILNAYATGNVTGKTSDQPALGALVGVVDGKSTIRDSYATGKVTATGGGLIGYQCTGADCLAFTGDIINSYWNKDTVGQGDFYHKNLGTALSTTQMKQQASFSNWDFNNIWQINEGNASLPLS